MKYDEYAYHAPSRIKKMIKLREKLIEKNQKKQDKLNYLEQKLLNEISDLECDEQDLEMEIDYLKQELEDKESTNQ